jgi:hypothetical protein
VLDPVTTAATRLCAACGLCCDGTLFHGVVLQPTDSPRTLAAHGLRIKRKRTETFFHQPCPAHTNGSCTIYPDRPTRCRAFDCRQLLQVATGEITEAQALATIQAARTQVQKVTHLIDQIAETNPARNLSHRAANALTTDNATPAHTALQIAHRNLETFLDANFRVTPR